jgi:hypothetical protein
MAWRHYHTKVTDSSASGTGKENGAIFIFEELLHFSIFWLKKFLLSS